MAQEEQNGKSVCFTLKKKKKIEKIFQFVCELFFSSVCFIVIYDCILFFIIIMLIFWEGEGVLDSSQPVHLN